MKQQLSPEQVEWFRQQALTFAQRAAQMEISPPPEDIDLPVRSQAEQDAEYQQFLQQHPGKGKLKIQVYTARGALPVEGAEVKIARPLSDGSSRVVYQGVTDESGILDNISLPALPMLYSQSPNTAADSGTEYLVSIYHPSFRAEDGKKVTIFDRVQTILPVLLYPQLNQ